MESVANAYASALFSLSLETDKTDKTLKEINQVKDILINNNELFDILKSRSLTKDEKKELIDNIFSKLLDKNVLNFIKLLIDKSRISYLLDITKEYRQIYLDHFQIKELIVYSSKALTKTDLKKIKDHLESQNNEKYDVYNKIDESLIGGIKVQINDLVLDGSIKNKLDRMKQSILEKNKNEVYS
jgi:F-type H+-transporting ATPase subunit delta